MELRDNENELGNSFFNEEDETPVDMEMIKEKIKLVPLSDMDFDEPPDDVMDVDCSMREQILAPLRLTPPDHSKFEDSPNMDCSQMETFGVDGAFKKVKTEAIEMAIEAGDTTATAAKVAAQIAANVVTGGVVAEAGPPPDFSSWTVEDDILLKTAMEAGAAIEALARGAMKFSQRYTARELRERWRALLYDPVISEEAALRMLKCEGLITNPGKLSSLNKLKYPQVSNRKRKLTSVRFHYYKRKKGEADRTNLNNLASKDNQEIGVKELDAGRESTFSQMVRLFVVDGVGDAAQAIPERTPLEHMKDASDNEAKGKQSHPEQEADEVQRCKDTELDVKAPNEGDGESEEICTTDAGKIKPLIVDVPPLEHMICVLNTEDTEIPSPPAGSTTHAPSLFSSRLITSVLEDKRVVSSLIKHEPVFEGPEYDTKRPANLRGSLSTLYSNISGVAAHINDKEALESQEIAGVHNPNNVLTSQDAPNADDECAVSDLSMVPGIMTELASPLQAGGLGHIDHGLCFTDQTSDVPTINKSAQACQEYEDGLESDQEMPSFSDVEAMILDMDLDPVFDEDALARAESRRLYRRHRKTLMRLEQGANAALERTLTLRGAIALLYGRQLRYYVTKNEVFLGRVTLDNSVDVDLGKEGRANKVSRRQATIRLKEDGVFYLKNLGRRDLFVNNIPIASGQHAILGSNCLIEVGGMRFIFEINKKLVRQRVEEMVSSRQLD